MKWLVVAWGVVAVAAGAFAADYAVEGTPGPASPYTFTPVTKDGATLELAWDNGTRRWSISYYTGADLWCGNDFSSATLKTEHVKILKFKMYTRDNWPNGVWDGFRIGFYSFAGGVPGSMLWPTGGSGYFFKPSGLSGHVWVECPINWTCPTIAFVAAAEEFYNYPNNDPFSLDINPTFLGHSWLYAQGSWSPYSSENVLPYQNIMIRVQVETGYTFPSVAPSSIGRVKALYY